MRIALTLLALLVSSWGRPGGSQLEVGGQLVEAHWVDGDTVRLGDDELRYRLLNVNALESDSTKHTIGDLSPATLAELSADATALARSQAWRCHIFRGRDAYGRGLIDCPDLAAAGLRSGVYMPYDFRCLGLFTGRDPALAAAVQEAKAKGVGIWARKWPPYFVTSVHPAKGLWAVSAVEVQTGCVRQFPVVLEDGRACIPNAVAPSCIKR